jgi:hypothetical protein
MSVPVVLCGLDQLFDLGRREARASEMPYSAAAQGQLLVFW